MRTLDTALETAQKKKSLKPAVKIVLTHGETTYTIEENRIRKLIHVEQPWRIHAKEVLLDNSDGYFTDLDLKGYQAVISWGLHTPEGAKYSATSPMWMTWQQLDSSPGALSCELTMLGIPDLMDEDEASEAYTPDEDNTYTVKTLLTKIAGATLSCFSHCQAFDVVYDSEDSLIDSYKPKDSFRIYLGGSRLAAFKRALEYCGCVARFESDGQVHVFVPTTSGTDYDYEYSLSSGHTFFAKSYRKSLVIPNYIGVQSEEDDDEQYSGHASDAESYALLPKRKYFQCTLESDDEADDIAQAILGRAQLNAEQGSASCPINCGAELYDYVKVTDERESDYRTGNIGYISRTFKPEKNVWEMEFGFGDPPTVRYTKELYQALNREVEGLNMDRLYVKDAYIENLSIDQINAVWLDPDGNVDLSQIGDTLDNLPDGEVYARVKSLHLDAGQIRLDENVFYSPGYNPTEKFDLGDNTLDDIPEGTVYKRTKSAALTADGLVVLDNVVVGTYGLVKSAYISAGRILLDEASGDLDDIANGSTYAKVKSTDISAGHIILSETIGDLDDIDDGSTYGKVKLTEISAGYIKLTTDQDLDAQGLEIVSSSSTTRIRINENRIAGYNAGTLQFELRASDGRAYAGGGAVILDEDGIQIRGEFLEIRSSAGTLRGSIYGGSYGMCVTADAGDNLSLGIGASYIGDGIGFTEGITQLLLNTSPNAYEGSFGYAGGGANTLKVYSSGAWRNNT